jgi:hypothetical protein
VHYSQIGAANNNSMSNCLHNLAEAVRVKANHTVRGEELNKLMFSGKEVNLRKRIRESSNGMDEESYMRGKGSRLNRVCYEIVTGEEEMAYLIDDALKRLRQYDDIRNKIKDMKAYVEELIAEDDNHDAFDSSIVDLTNS